VPDFGLFLIVKVGNTWLFIALIVWQPSNNSIKLDFQNLILLELSPVDVDLLLGDLIMVNQLLVLQVFELGELYLDMRRDWNESHHHSLISAGEILDVNGLGDRRAQLELDWLC
jgi:hypothetical protein